MEIEYENNKVKKILENHALMKKRHGFELTRSIIKRVEQIKATETFAEYLKMGLGKPHPLSGEQKDYYAVSADSNKRLIIKPKSQSKDIEALEECKTLIIKGVDDYHGEKRTQYIP